MKDLVSGSQSGGRGQTSCGRGLYLYLFIWVSVEKEHVCEGSVLLDMSVWEVNNWRRTDAA